jgi:hypothetical protein
MDFFEAFDIRVVPGEQNFKADMLAVVVTTLEPCDELVFGESKMEIIFRPSVPDDLEH